MNSSVELVERLQGEHPDADHDQLTELFMTELGLDLYQKTMLRTSVRMYVSVTTRNQTREVEHSVFQPQSGQSKRNYTGLGVIDRVAARDRLLQEKFSWAPGEYISWGEAQVRHHQARIEWQAQKIAGIQANIDAHQQIIAGLERHGATCLNDLPAEKVDEILYGLDLQEATVG